MKRLTYSLVVVAAAAAFAIGFSGAFFSDQEVSTGNTFRAGDLDLKVDNTSYYNGAFNQETSWDPADLNDGQGPSGNGTYKFLNFLDIKPSDWGEDTISLRVDTNDAWACYNVTLTSNADNTCNEPENLDDPLCEPGTQSLTSGELGAQVQFALWKDDGDNVYEEDDGPILYQGSLSSVIPQLNGALADASGGILGLGGQPMTGTQTYYLGKYWCFGTLSPAPLVGNTGTSPIDATGFTCDGSTLNNSAQTDILTADISFTAVQARNNPSYLCNPPDETPTPTPTPDPLLWIIGDIENSQLDEPIDELNFVAFGNFPTPPAIGAPYTRVITSPVDDVADEEFPWNSNFNANYGRNIYVDFNYVGPTIPVRLSVGWSPGISESENKDIYLDASLLGTTGTIIGESTPGWWNNMPRYVHTFDFNLTNGNHILEFRHTVGDGTLWDFIKLERL